jgi:beta-galactosidase
MKPLTIRMLLAVAGILAVNARVRADDSPRQMETLDFGWKFMLGDQVGAQDAAYDDSKWQAIDLPHDWSIHLDFDKDATSGRAGGFLPTGIGWYRRTFRVPDADKGKVVEVEFEGIREHGEVWLNGHSLGVRPYGYTSVVYDMSEYLNYGDKDNTLSVRVDNSTQPNSRWYAGSGIYRHSWLLVTERLHVPQWGTYVTTPNASAAGATVNIAVQVTNGNAAPAKFTLSTVLIDAEGNEVQRTSGEERMQYNSYGEFTQQVYVAKPHLWSVNVPYMYTVRTTISQGSVIVDRYDTPIGIRSIAWDVDRGFLLNGAPVKLNGVCLHADGGPVGVAVPIGVWMRRLQELKDMGCNAIRTSHNPPDPDFLDLCDRMGFCVMDEAYDEWQLPKGQVANGCHLFYDEWHVRDTTDFIHRDRNHPCVVIWSAGNEIAEQTSDTGAAVLKELVDIFHEQDPTRPVTAACDKAYAEPKSASAEFMALQDVAGYNYVDRWRTRAELYYSIDRREFPERRFIGTESGSMGGVRGSYGAVFPVPQVDDGSPPKPLTMEEFFATYRSSVPRIGIEKLWKFVRSNDYVTGDFMWTGIDYLGEGGVSSPSGVLDTCGFKKDGYYFYQSQWTTKPMVHLLPHWNWKGNEGKQLTVYAYTNCDSVELFLNGRSLGVKGYEFPVEGMEKDWGNSPPRSRAPHTTSDLHLAWDVTYEPGTLKAVGRRAGHVVASDEVTTTGDPSGVQLTIDKSTASADGRDVVHAVVQIVDSEGRTVPTADNDVTFEVQGEGKIIGVDNGNGSMTEHFQGNERHAFNGYCLAIVQTTRTSGPIRIIARSAGLRDAEADVNKQ